MTHYHLTLRSENAKVGPIPVSTSSRSTCPPSCRFKNNGCYAEGGKLRFHWNAVSAGERGGEWSGFLDKIRALPLGVLWRHNQAGDLPGKDGVIDAAAVKQLVEANVGKRGFTYTHYPVLRTGDKRTNGPIVRHANEWGFTINLSADNLEEADKLAALEVGPVVTTLPRTLHSPGKRVKLFTPAGRRVVVCPAQTHEGVTCSTCKLCAISERPFIVGFLAHGTGAGRVERIFNERTA